MRRGFVGLLPRLLEIACINPHQTGFVGEGSDHLQLDKFRPSLPPGKGSVVGRKNLALPYYSQHAVYVSLRVLFFSYPWVIQTHSMFMLVR